MDLLALLHDIVLPMQGKYRVKTYFVIAGRRRLAPNKKTNQCSYMCSKIDGTEALTLAAKRRFDY
jgi:hypothetical protein